MRNLIIKKILSTLLNSEFITKHHINSYNQFVSEDIQNTFQKMNPIYIKNGYDENKKTYAYKNRIFIGGKDGSAYYFSVPTIHLPNKEPAQLTPNYIQANQSGNNWPRCCYINTHLTNCSQLHPWLGPCRDNA